LDPSPQSEQTLQCTETDIIVLNDELKSIRRTLIWAGITILVIASVLPWLGSSRTHGKAMVDYISFPGAFASIVVVLSLIPVFYYFTSAPKVKKDLAERIKVCFRSAVEKKELLVYKKTKGRFLVLNPMPPGVKYIPLTIAEFEIYNENDAVEVEFFPHSKKIIKVRKV
jgi:hypothetical protein